MISPVGVRKLFFRHAVPFRLLSGSPSKSVGLANNARKNGEKIKLAKEVLNDPCLYWYKK
jgi:hypothetical protein